MRERQKFQTRTIRLVGEVQRDTAIAMLRNLPLDADKPLEIVAREEQKPRTLDANARMWAGPLRDVATQAWVERRQFSADVWHEHFKEQFLPEDDDPNLAELVKDPETWRKWDYTPKGRRICVGSTTRLTRRGFYLYMQQIEAFGANLGVLFSESPTKCVMKGGV